MLNLVFGSLTSVPASPQRQSEECRRHVHTRRSEKGLHTSSFCAYGAMETASSGTVLRKVREGALSLVHLLLCASLPLSVRCQAPSNALQVRRLWLLSNGVPLPRPQQLPWQL